MKNQIAGSWKEYKSNTHRIKQKVYMLSVLELLEIHALCYSCKEFLLHQLMLMPKSEKLYKFYLLCNSTSPVLIQEIYFLPTFCHYLLIHLPSTLYHIPNLGVSKVRPMQPMEDEVNLLEHQEKYKISLHLLFTLPPNLIKIKLK